VFDQFRPGFAYPPLTVGDPHLPMARGQFVDCLINVS
ncbi:uncharacterized protein METZ01_LOCUS166352, partial [marine metagenome]